MLRCADDSLYTGITTDLSRRISEHNEWSLGAKYTKIRRPVRLVWSTEVEDRSTASKLEYEIKKLTRRKKEEMIVWEKKKN